MNNRTEPEGSSDADKSRKPRTQQQKNSEFFATLEQLEQRISALEKDRNTPLYSRRSEFRKDYCELEEVDLKGTNERKSESNYDELMHEERTCLQEVAAMEKKFDSWSQLPAPATAAVDVKKAAGAITVSLPPAVAAFERFLAQTGGHSGGWDDYDQQLFLKLKSKHKLSCELQDQRFLEEALMMCDSMMNVKRKPSKNGNTTKRHLEIKAQVEEYARQKAEEHAILQAARHARHHQEKEANKITAEEAAKIQERSQKMLDERKAKLKVKEVQKQEKEKRLQKLKSQVEVNVSRDPSRLYKLTAGWEQRKKEGPGTAGHGPSLHMPHRAVPSWRQGLS
ncbi:hypothetical protein pdam_00000202 [Pocillopora damicornis]|uniref:Coiled-coil domain-containing protein 112 n=1 Tax=Pocillopora damicornis TaxID=46731 RepID=A0A3M6UX31_POCDA|nr:hypothetical protein pdam_00000202 [Pocillopora damicornis]